MKKKGLVISCVVVGVVALLYFFVSNGTITFDTYSESEKTVSAVRVVEELEDGCFYVWHNEKIDDIQEDLTVPAESNVFLKCPLGDINWKENSYVGHTIWFSSENDVEIPTFYPGDELIFVSSTYVPYKGIEWERFSDLGYTIGVANMKSDNSGHYRIANNSEDGYRGYLYQKSDANELEKYVNVSNLFLDKIDGVEVRDNIVSEYGTITGLEKDKDYVCEWYTGTYYQDYRMKANVHTFCSLETFTTYDYDFLHSRCISVTIPEWLKTGYYYIDEIGFFRYIEEADAQIYNGQAYDAAIDWNDPIIVYDDEGHVMYDPTGEEVFIRDSSETHSMKEEALSDVGAEGYESIENETVVP